MAPLPTDNNTVDARQEAAARSRRDSLSRSLMERGFTEAKVAEIGALHHLITRRRLGAAGVGALALANPSWAETTIDLPLPGGPGARPITTGFPQKGPMILQRTRPPLLETPFEVFDKSVFTPNDQFYVRWHWAVIPTDIDIGKFSLTVRGHVNQALSLSLNDILQGLPSVQLSAVNQCSAWAAEVTKMIRPRKTSGQSLNIWLASRARNRTSPTGLRKTRRSSP
jgi:DMSO/TMAO reductase YedYZ molybdopterin-dependent catalytic subunit